MITFKSGSIFTSQAQCIVNPVNCVGVMGKGLALEFKKRYPDMFSRYHALCNKGEISVGKIAFWKPKIGDDPIICLFPTKNHWREKSTVSIIEQGLQQYVKYSPKLDITSAAFPKIGCGLGGLSFELQVAPLMKFYLDPLPYEVEIYVD